MIKAAFSQNILRQLTWVKEGFFGPANRKVKIPPEMLKFEAVMTAEDAAKKLIRYGVLALAPGPALRLQRRRGHDVDATVGGDDAAVIALRAGGRDVAAAGSSSTSATGRSSGSPSPAQRFRI